MIIIDKVTTRYIAHEDRIALTGEGVRGESVRVWLIRPLTQKLVSALVDGVKPAHTDERTAHLIDSFAQSKAEERHEPIPPVEYHPGTANPAGSARQAADVRVPGLQDEQPARTPPASEGQAGEEWLVVRINLKLVEGKFVLTFFGENDRKAGILFTEERLRQWLGILRGACLKAEWSSPDWPEWMHATPAPGDDASSVH